MWSYLHLWVATSAVWVAISQTYMLTPLKFGLSRLACTITMFNISTPHIPQTENHQKEYVHMYKYCLSNNSGLRLLYCNYCL